jgi:4-hydroxybenzoate polyprenyltransferase
VLATASPSSSPCPAALASASQSSPAVVDALLVSADLASTAHLLALFGVGALLLRGAGCTVNDLWDREIDKKVTRTASRPLARGAVSPAEAAAFLAAQLAAGAAVLSQLNPASVVVGVAALPLVALYPLAKRVTDWPQVRSRRGKRRQREGERVFEEQESKRARLNDDEKTHFFFSLLPLLKHQAVLGLTFNWGALLGWTAVKGGSESALEILARSAGAAAREAGSSSSSFALEPALAALSSAAAAPALSSLASSPAPWLLYSAGVCWTLAYDTIYAYQDSSDDVEAGVRSSALALRSLGLERAGVAAFGVAAVALLAAAGASAGIGGAAFYGSVILGPGVHMAWQVGTLDPRDPRNCAERFRSNAAFGGLAVAAIAAGVAASQG